MSVHQVPSQHELTHAEGKEAEGYRADSHHHGDMAIVGMACRFPGADNYAQFWDNLCQGVSSISEIPQGRWDKDAFYSVNGQDKNKSTSKWGGFVDGVECFDADFFGISAREARVMDPQQRIMLEQAWACLEDAGYDPATFSGSNTGVYIGVFNFDYEDHLRHALDAIEGHVSTGTHTALIPNRISYFLNLHGPSLPIDTACSSSLVALHKAAHAVRRGECDQALVGGVSVLCSPTHFISFSKTGMLSPDGSCKTFDERANGYVRGEGAAMILIKPLDKAIRDKDRIVAVLRGSAVNHGGRARTVTYPGSLAQSNVIAEAMRQANVPVGSIGYVEAHGTGTPKGDPIEVEGLKMAFARVAADRGEAIVEGSCGIASVKTNIGHLESVAGLAGVIKTILCMKHKAFPPLVHYQKLNPRIALAGSPFFIVDRAQPWPAQVDLHGVAMPRRAGISSFGFGGVNSHVIIEEYVEPHDPIANANDKSGDQVTPELILLSAKTATALRERVRQLLAALASPELRDASLADLAYTLRVGRQAMAVRLALVVDSVDSLRERLDDWLVRGSGAAGIYAAELSVEAQMLVGSEMEHDDAWHVLFAERDLHAIARKWIDGHAFDWMRLHTEGARRLALPTYPFAKERHWVDAELSLATAARQATLHPLVHRNTSNAFGLRFSSRFTGKEFFLADHVVRGERTLPGAAQLEMMRSVGGEVVAGRGHLRLKDVVWLRPIVAGAKSLALHIALFPERPGEYSFELYDDTEADDALVYTQGSLLLASLPDAVAPIDIAAMRQQCSRAHVNAVECYAVFDRMGLSYGPAHRALEALFVGQGQALARVSLPAAVQPMQESYVLHPSLLDAALQAAIALQAHDAGRWGEAVSMLPFALGSLETLSACVGSMWVAIRRSAGSGPSDALQKFDIDLCDESGAICARLSEFCARAATVSEVDALPQTASVTPEKTAQPSIASHEATDEFQERATRYFVRLLSSALKRSASSIDARAPMEAYGIDSILVMDLTRTLEQVFGPLSKTLLFEYQTIAALVGHFLENHRERLAEVLGETQGEANEVGPVLELEAPVVQSAPAPRRPRFGQGVQELVGVARGDTGRLKPAVSQAVDEIAIIGVAGRYPQADNLEQFWVNLSQGKDSITEIPSERWDHTLYYDQDRSKTGKTYSKWGGFLNDVDKFDPLFFNISPREAELMDPQERLFLECVHATLEDAGYTRETVARRPQVSEEGSVGVFVGVMYEEYQLYGAQEQARGNNLAMLNSAASVANRISYYCNFNGPSLALDTMCSSSLTAIHLACESLQRGGCSVAIAGGVNVSIHPNKYLMLAQGKFISGKGRCESFGEGGEGYVPGEGVGAVLLKPLAQAIADGDHIYGVIKATAINHGGKTNGYTVPNPNA
ncbi:MAG TPA: beta-ketoacyl synthase N-terminal-like domain-containing protein, partial [Dyella sp.]|uniref:beta-ketoacyl synthase N-terminal-like domain-containing protein n=1 Tax=Dyella sp. TaxID=1869338 RepID=UPI002F929A05